MSEDKNRESSFCQLAIFILLTCEFPLSLTFFIIGTLFFDKRETSKVKKLLMSKKVFLPSGVLFSCLQAENRVNNIIGVVFLHQDISSHFLRNWHVKDFKNSWCDVAKFAIFYLFVILVNKDTRNKISGMGCIY